MKNLQLKGLVAAVLVAFGMSANAATTSDTFTVTATVAASCAVHADDIAFGSVTPNEAGTAQTASGEIRSTCTNTTPFTLTINAGSSADALAREMVSSVDPVANTDVLAYNLYSDAGYTTVFDDVTGVTGTGSGVEQAVPVYASLNTDQFIRPDSYIDTLTVTLTY